MKMTRRRKEKPVKELTPEEREELRIPKLKPNATVMERYLYELALENAERRKRGMKELTYGEYTYKPHIRNK